MIQRTLKCHKQKLGVAVLRGMLLEFRILTNILRYKLQKAEFICSQRDVRYPWHFEVGLACKKLFEKEMLSGRPRETSDSHSTRFHLLAATIQEISFLGS